MGTVTREIVIDAPVPTVWHHISDPVERERWIGGDLDVDLDEVEDGRSVTFTWGEDTDASRVRIEVEPEGEGSRVRVTETTDLDTAAPTDRTAGGMLEDEPAGTGEVAAPEDPVASVVPLRLPGDGGEDVAEEHGWAEVVVPWARAA